MSITATELKNNLGKYLELALTEDIVVMKNGRAQAVLSSPYKTKTDILKSLRGCIPQDKTFEEMMDERTSKI